MESALQDVPLAVTMIVAHRQDIAGELDKGVTPLADVESNPYK